MGFCGIESGKKWSLDKKDTANSATTSGRLSAGCGNAHKIISNRIVEYLCRLRLEIYSNARMSRMDETVV